MRRRQNNELDIQDAFRHQNEHRPTAKRRNWEGFIWFRRFKCTKKMIVMLAVVTLIISVMTLLSIVVKPNHEIIESGQRPNALGVATIQPVVNSSEMQNVIKPSSEVGTQGPSRLVVIPNEEAAVELNLHEAEDAFLRTLKSSYPNNIPALSKDAGDGDDVSPGERNVGARTKRKRQPLPDRIGIIAPPGYITTMVSKWIKQHVIEVKSSSNSTATIKGVAIIPTSHAPPYGYGKNHGWKKVVRLTTRPAMLGVADAMLFLLASNKINIYDDKNQIADGNLTKTVLGGMLRQYVRWHCRLSHVSAHTAVHTVHLSPEALESNPEEIIQDVLNFIYERPIDRKILDDMPIVLPPAERLKLNQHMQNIANFANTIVTHSKMSIRESSDPVDYKEGCESTEQPYQCILQEELDSTNQLQAWPCRSLWENIPRRQTGVTYKNLDGVDKHNLHEFLLFQMASRLGPDCLSDRVKCTIQKDLCEEASDLSLCGPE